MARKAVVTKKMILEGAFLLVKREGIQNLTARKLAQEIGCSTQPVFRLYENMKELEGEVVGRAADYYSEYCTNFPKVRDTPFVDLGLSYITFAKRQEALFRLLFVDGKAHGRSMYDLINGEDRGFVIAEIKKIEGLSSNQASELFMLLWTFIHGLACMALTDDSELDEEETVKMLEGAYQAFSQR